MISVIWLLNRVWLLWPHGLYPTRLLCPWNSPGKNILEWVTTSFSRGFSLPRDWTLLSFISYIGRRILYCWAPREAPLIAIYVIKQHRSFSNIQENNNKNRYKDININRTEIKVERLTTKKSGPTRCTVQHTQKKW